VSFQRLKQAHLMTITTVSDVRSEQCRRTKKYRFLKEYTGYDTRSWTRLTALTSVTKPAIDQEQQKRKERSKPPTTPW
jgi:hypothetical protein